MIGQSRRGFLQTVAAAAGAAVLENAPAQTTEVTTSSIIDTNVSLGQWPFRRHELNDTPAVVAKLRANGITEAWASSFDALLHKDISSVNTRIAEECRHHGQGMLLPIGAINPRLPGWEEDLRRCVEVHQMRGVRLHPNYHGYKLGDAAFERLIQLAQERGLLVQIAVIMEEERTLHPLVSVPATDTAPLAAVIEKFPKVRIQLLNAFRTLRGAPLLSLASRGVGFEIAMLEGVAGIARLLEQFPTERLCFGSHAPFFYAESAKLKLQESALHPAQMKALCFENARRFLPRP